MKKGMALEGYIQEDGTVRPMRQYDDTELRAKIQTNKDDIDNLKSKASSLDTRVEYLEEHGGAEDQTKADKVAGATEGNFAGLDENGNLTDSGSKPSDFAPASGSTNYAPASGSTNYAPASHTHGSISDFTGTNGVGASVEVGEDHETQGLGVIELTVKGDGMGTDSKSATIHYNNIDNLNNALSGNAGNKISDFTGINGCGASVEVGEDPDSQGEGIVKITVKGDGTATDSDSAKINYDNIGNLQRALKTPSSAPENDATKLITSQAVYNALAGKTSLVIDPLIVLQKGSSLAEYTLLSSSETQTNLTAIHSNLEGKAFVTKVYVRNNGADMSFQGVGYVDPTSTYGAISIIIGDIYVSIIRASANASWTLEGVYKVSEIF